MDKENGDKHDSDKKKSSAMNGGGGGGGGNSGLPDPNSLLDASSLFGKSLSSLHI